MFSRGPTAKRHWLNSFAARVSSSFIISCLDQAGRKVVLIAHFGRTTSIAWVFTWDSATHPWLLFLARHGTRSNRSNREWAGDSSGFLHRETISTLIIPSRSHPNKFGPAQFSTTTPG